MDVPARSFCQPVADQRRLVRGVVIPDQVGIEAVRDALLDLIEEFTELLRAMAAIALPNHMASCDVEGGKERSRTMTRVVMAAPGGLARPHGQHRLSAIQGLNLALLIDAKHDSVLAMTASIWASSIVRGAPERGSSRSPSKRCSTKRRRHLPTVPLATRRCAATSRFSKPPPA